MVMYARQLDQWVMYAMQRFLTTGPFVKEGCVELYMCWVAGLCRGRVPKVPIAGSAEGLTPGVRETS